MKPLKSETQDAEALRELGRASVQIVHDLKNQLNGLKLYATFLRKRLEKAERPADELETIAKLIAGLERAASDTATLVRYSRPLELRPKPRMDLSEMVAAVAAEGETVHTEAGLYEGEFDSVALTEALRSITEGARPKVGDGATPGGALEIHLWRDESVGAPVAVIEWRGVKSVESDVFRSFAGGRGLRLALAAKIIRAHGGEVEQEADILRAHLPLAP